MCPHFFSDASWSSRCTPAAPASIIALVSSKTFRWPPKPASMSATIGTSQSISSLPSAWSIWSARSSAPLIAAHHLGDAVDRVQALVGVHLAREVGVGGDLPAAEVDRLEAGADLLHGLVAGAGAERGDVRAVVQEVPELLGADARERVLDPDGAAQALDVLRSVGPLDALPALRVGWDGMGSAADTRLLLDGGSSGFLATARVR